MGMKQEKFVTIHTYESNKKVLEDWIKNNIDGRYDSLNWNSCTIRDLFVFAPSAINDMITMFFAPSGSKFGWEHQKVHSKICDDLVSFVDSMAYEDGSNSYTCVVCEFGEINNEMKSNL
jgi:hypothetical protein